MFKASTRKLMLGAVALVATALFTAAPAFAQKTKITVYSALETDQVGPYKL